jgi:hypothetical protein
MPVITIHMNYAARLWNLDRRTVWQRIKSGDLQVIEDTITGKKAFDVDYVKDIMANGLPWRRKPSESLAVSG